MGIVVKPSGMSSLYVTKARIITEGACVDNSKTQVKGKGILALAWDIEVAHDGDYHIAVNLSLGGIADLSLSSNESRVLFSAKNTNGYFSDPEMNLERVESSDCLTLQKGNQVITLEVKCEDFISVSSIELYPNIHSKAREAELAEATQRRPSTAHYAKKGYGMMVHWTGQSHPRYGEPKSYEQAVADFDTDRFAMQAKEAGMAYVFLTANHAIRHFPAPLTTWEEHYPGFTTKRDLIEDLYQSLKRHGIDLMLYLNFTAAYLSSPYANIEDHKNYTYLSASQENHYMEVAISLLNAIGNRYGSKVKAYWIDSCYQLNQQFSTDFKSLYEAAKTGYEDRLVSFNYWILPVATPWNDFWAGETARFVNVPDKSVPSYGPAKGNNYHELIIMENDWGHFVKDTPIPDPHYNAQQLAKGAIERREMGGMLTINPMVYQDGSISEKTMNVLKELKKLVKEPIV